MSDFWRSHKSSLSEQLSAAVDEWGIATGAAYVRLEKEIAILEQKIAKVDLKIASAPKIALIAILEPHNDDLLPVITKAYQLALRQRSIQKPLSDIVSYIDDLHHRPQAEEHSHPPLERFVAYLRTDSLDLPRSIRNQLSQWSRDYIANLSFLDQQIATEQSQLDQQEPCLLIRITRKGEHYLISAWYIEDIQAYRKQPPSGSNPLSVGGYSDPDTPTISAESALDHPFKASQLENVIRYLREQCIQRYCNPELIHLFLPTCLLNSNIDQWQTKPKKPLVLGTEHRTIFLRSEDRLDPKYEHSRTWQTKWSALEQKEQGNAHHHLVSADPHNVTDIYAKARPRDCVGLLLKHPLCSASMDLEEIFDYLLMETDVPLALWQRQRLPDLDHDTELQRVLEACCLNTLAEQLFTERLEALSAPCHIGKTLSLLRDDPKILPPGVNLKAS